MCDRPPPNPMSTPAGRRRSPRRPAARPDARRRLRRAVLVGLRLLVLAAPVGVWVGCTAESKYKTLSFFFDGAPAPNAPKAAAGGAAGDEAGPAKLAGAVSVHKPYAEQNCTACHAST